MRAIALEKSGGLDSLVYADIPEPEPKSQIKAFGLNHAEIHMRRGGRSCLAGWLRGLDPIPDFNPLLQMASGAYLTFFGSFVFGTPGFPLSDVPLRDIAADVAAGPPGAKPAHVFRFGDIHEAHRVLEANEAHGKMGVIHG